MKQKKEKFLVSIETEQKEKSWKETGFFYFLSLCLLFILVLGVNYGFHTILSLSVSRKTILAICLFSALWTTTIMYLNYKKIGYVTTGIGFLLYCVTYWGEICPGFQLIMNQMLVKINMYYRARFTFFSVEDYNAKTILYALGFLIYLFTFLCGFYMIEKKRTSILLICSLFVMIAGFLLGEMISQDALFLLTGVTFCSLCLERRSYVGRTKSIKSIGFSVGMMVVFFSLFLVAGKFLAEPKLKEPLEQWHKALYSWDIKTGKSISSSSIYNTINDKLNRLLYKKSSGMLTNQEPNHTGEEILSVTIKADENKLNQNIYLKGWVGSTYEDSHWNALSNESFYEEAKNWNLEKNADAGISVQNLLYEHLKEFPLVDLEQDRYDMYIEQSEHLPYKYVPYGVNLDNKAGSFADGYIKKDGKKYDNYSGLFIYEDFISYKFISAYMEGSKEPLAILWNQENQSISDIKTYLYRGKSNIEGADEDGKYYMDDNKKLPKEVEKLEKSYITYVKQEYTKVPEKGLEKLSSICKNINMDSILYAKKFIIDYLHKNTKYSTNLKSLSYGEDFVNHFLFDEKKGFCTHYATTATLMFRMMGFPARYVSGYVITPSMFEKIDEGFYKAKVPDSNAHAWTEVYVDGKGWIPIEVTPGYDKIEERIEFSNNKLNNNIDTTITPTPAQNNKINKDNQNNLNQEDKKNNEGNGKQKEIWDFTLDTILIQFLSKIMWLFGAVVFGLCFIFIRRKVIKLRREKRIAHQNDKEAVKNISYEMHRILEYSGYKKDKYISDEEYGNYIARQLDYWNLDEYNRFITVIREACYSEHEIVKEDRVFCESVYKKVYKNEQMKKKAFERLYWKYALCY